MAERETTRRGAVAAAQSGGGHTADALGRTAVLSPGGVGGLVAGLLARDGYDTAVVATESTAAHIAAAGLRIEASAFGDFTVHPPAAPALDRDADVLVVGCKATALDAALDRIPPEHVRGALVVPLLNGFDHIDLLRRRLPDAHVLAAAIRVESTRIAPGHIVQSSPFTALDIARAPGAPPERLDALAAALAATGLEVRLRDDPAEVLWRKFQFLLPTAAVCAHRGADIGTVRSGEGRADLHAVAREVERVGRAEGVALDAGRVLEMFDGIPGGTKPSMLRDREAGRRMEVDALGGAFLRRAAAHGIPVPAAARIVDGLHRIDAGLG